MRVLRLPVAWSNMIVSIPRILVSICVKKQKRYAARIYDNNTGHARYQNGRKYTRMLLDFFKAPHILKVHIHRCKNLHTKDKSGRKYGTQEAHLVLALRAVHYSPIEWRIQNAFVSQMTIRDKKNISHCSSVQLHLVFKEASGICDENRK